MSKAGKDSILGQTGAGKSHFINMADPSLKTKPVVSNKITSCTQQVEVFEVEDPRGAQVIVRLIDTPGFNDSESTNDDKHLKMITEWLKKEPNNRVAGILYLHEIDSVRLEQSPTLVKPQDIPHPPGVFVITTKWSLVSEELGKARETELRQHFNVPLEFMKRFDNTKESAWAIIDAVLSSPSDVRNKQLAKAMKKYTWSRIGSALSR